MNLTHLVCPELTRLALRGYLQIPLKTFVVTSFFSLIGWLFPPAVLLSVGRPEFH
jgi:hypothetical protein